MTDEGTAGGGSAYEIRRAFKAAQNKFVDAFPFKGKYLICDGNREVRYYEPYISATTYAPYSADPTFDVFPYCGCYWKDRLFFGRFIEGSTTIRNRIRWTTTLDPTVLPTLQYVDLPYTPGHIRRLMGLGNYLMCYMSDALWVGRQTNYGDQLPYAFDTRLDTGGAGLVGDRAVYPALSGHFLVLDDGIYYLSPEGKLEDIGDPIRKDFFGNPDDLWSVQVCLDPIRTRIVFSQPSSSQSFTRIWSFDFRAKAWSYDEVDATLVSLKQIWRGYTYDAWLTSGPYSYDVGLAIFPTYDSIGGGSTQDLLFGIGSYVYAQGAETLTQDNSTGNIPVTIESPDIDYDNPDKSRVHLRLSVKLKEAITEAVTFTVSVSTDRGRTWRALGGRALTISANQDENYVNFRSKGSTFRFKLESTSVCRSYCIQEFVLSKVDKGQEGHLPSNP
jgi:hypothetical protein